MTVLLQIIWNPVADPYFILICNILNQKGVYLYNSDE